MVNENYSRRYEVRELEGEEALYALGEFFSDKDFLESLGRALEDCKMGRFIEMETKGLF